MSSHRRVCRSCSQATPKALSREEISEATRKDATLQEVMHLISTGQSDSLKPVEWVDPNTLKIFANMKSKLTSVDGNLVLRGSRIVLPYAFKKWVTELAHKGYQKLVKVKSLLHSKVWFSRMDSLVDSIVKRCVPCQVAMPKSFFEPLQWLHCPKVIINNLLTYISQMLTRALHCNSLTAQSSQSLKSSQSWLLKV